MNYYYAQKFMDKHVKLKHSSLKETPKSDKDSISKHNLYQQGKTSRETYLQETYNNVSKSVNVHKAESKEFAVQLETDPTTERNMSRLNFDELMSEKKVGNPKGLDVSCVTCVMCNKQFTGDLYLKKHIKLNHSVKEEPGTTLDLKESKDSNDKRNVNTIEYVDELSIPKEDCDIGSEETILCRICGLELDNIMEYTEHIKIHLDADAPESQHNGQAGIKTESLSRKIQVDPYIKIDYIHRKMQSFSCRLCDKTLNSKFSATEHIRAIHRKTRNFQPQKIEELYIKIGVSFKKVKYFTCRLCDKTNPNRTNIAKHIEAVHLTKKTFLCTFCGQSYTYRNSLISHVNFVHHKMIPLTPLQCKLCKRSFSKESYLNEHYADDHYKLKPRLKPFSCTLCYETFIQKRNLHEHVAAVHYKRSFSCTFCEKSFTFKEYLSAHIIAAHQNVFACTFCDKSFSSEQSRTQHVEAAHKKQNPFTCTFCKKSLGSKQSLSAHVDIVHHKLKKGGTCTLCNKSFAHKNYLTTHMKLVHEQNPLNCTLCEQTYEDIAELTSHVNVVHNRLHPFPCRLCNSSFAKEGNMKNHRNTVHT